MTCSLLPPERGQWSLQRHQGLPTHDGALRLTDQTNKTLQQGEASSKYEVCDRIVWLLAQTTIAMGPVHVESNIEGRARLRVRLPRELELQRWRPQLS